MDTLDKPKKRSNRTQNKIHTRALLIKVKHKISNKKEVVSIDN